MKDNNQKINEIKKSIEFVKLNKIKEASIILSSLLNDEDLKTELCFKITEIEGVIHE